MKLLARMPIIGFLQRPDLFDLGSQPAQPTGYAPQMMVTCMNDPGTGATPDPCTTRPTASSATNPVHAGANSVHGYAGNSTSAFAGAGYNNPDCSYPTLTRRSAKWMAME